MRTSSPSTMPSAAQTTRKTVTTSQCQTLPICALGKIRKNRSGMPIARPTTMPVMPKASGVVQKSGGSGKLCSHPLLLQRPADLIQNLGVLDGRRHGPGLAVGDLLDGAAE